MHPIAMSALALSLLLQSLNPFAQKVEPESWITENSFHLPIILYHSVLEIPHEGNIYQISVDEMESDLQYITEQGYNTIHVTDLINYIHYDGLIPENPILLTFDDGYRDNYTNLLPLLEKYQCKVVICPISYNSENTVSDALSPHMSLEELRILEESPWVELQSHTYNLHFFDGREGALRKVGETYDTYQNIFREDVRQNEIFFQENNLSQPTTFVYPGGNTNQETHQLVLEAGFVASMITWPEEINYIDRNDPNCLYNMARFNREGGFDSQEFFDQFS